MRVNSLLYAALFFFCLASLCAEDMIVLNTTPQGATVYWAGKKMGVTPLSITRSTPGAPDFFGAGRPAYELYFSKDFFETEVENVAYKGTSPATYTVVLKPIARLPFYDGVYKGNRFLDVQEVLTTDLAYLARLREEVYARYGRPIKDRRFIEYFKKTRWYRENPYYSDKLLTNLDLNNIKLINDFLEVNPADEALFAAIMKQYEFFTADKKASIRFVNARTCVVEKLADTGAGVNDVSGAFYMRNEESPSFGFIVAGGRIYLLGTGYNCIVTLDLDKKQLKEIQVLQGSSAFEYGYR